MASSTIQVALRIPPALYDDVKIAAHGQQTSITRWVMAAMLEKLERDSAAASLGRSLGVPSGRRNANRVRSRT